MNLHQTTKISQVVNEIKQLANIVSNWWTVWVRSLQMLFINLANTLCTQEEQQKRIILILVNELYVINYKKKSINRFEVYTLFIKEDWKGEKQLQIQNIHTFHAFIYSLKITVCTCFKFVHRLNKENCVFWLKLK